MVSKETSLGHVFEQDVLVKKLLDAVPDKYFQLVASIEQSADLDSLMFEDVVGRLKAFEEHLRGRERASSSQGQFSIARKSFIDLDVVVYNELGEERVSPRSGKIYYKPVVSPSLKPVIGMVFDSVELAYAFYVIYAHASGFSVRKNSAYTNHGLLKLKYYVWSKEGFKSGSEYTTLDDANNGKRKHRKPSKRTGCGAHIKFRLNDKNKYEVYVYEEKHNHNFMHKDDIQFLTSARMVDYVKESAIQVLSQVNLGPVRAFNILKSFYGGYEQVGVTKNDFKNFKTRQSEYISEYNADIVNKCLEKKKKHCPNFSFDYTIKEDGTLGGLFWADENSKKSYLVFGDVVGFDVTYRSNKYDMVFVPFTGIDNHNRNITLGAALLGSENANSYRWLLRVGPVTPNVAEFKEKLAQIVWTDSITTDEFEEKFPSILSEYGLSDHEWLADLYKIRKDWIPAYYLPENFSGLMRTTSRSESENHFFNQFCNPRSTLVEFFCHFEAVVESQWNEHRGNDHHSRYTIPGFMNPTFVLESQAAKLFTRTIFLSTTGDRGWPEEFGENRAYVEAVLRQLRYYAKGYMSKADEAQVVALPPAGEIDMHK
ncbi:protein FAR1-RELATED SEQUENCE 5-like [Bidens hawaiensis]|uniref:protein FAR1-RELATED SEQUENCE 5-like n=1 Tax=Bidens hawaiensis TaxID=980011 RepID=UPI00404B890C